MWANPTNMPPMKITVILSGILIVCVTLTASGYGLYAGMILFFCALGYFLSRPIKSNKSEFVDTPWGGYRNVAQGDGYKIKILVITGGQATSLQSHKHRNEIWTVSKGTARVTYGNDKYLSGYDATFDMATGSTIKILSGFKHRIVNNGEDPIVITEVWLGDILEEEDIIRYEDRYGRV